jgi:hypothetical protein
MRECSNQGCQNLACVHHRDRWWCDDCYDILESRDLSPRAGVVDNTIKENKAIAKTETFKQQQ